MGKLQDIAARLDSLNGKLRSDAGETTWMTVTSEMMSKLQVGKTYMFDGRKGTVMKKDEAGATLSSGWGGRQMVLVKWK